MDDGDIVPLYPRFLLSYIVSSLPKRYDAQQAFRLFFKMDANDKEHCDSAISDDDDQQQILTVLSRDDEAASDDEK